MRVLGFALVFSVLFVKALAHAPALQKTARLVETPCAAEKDALDSALEARSRAQSNPFAGTELNGMSIKHIRIAVRYVNAMVRAVTKKVDLQKKAVQRVEARLETIKKSGAPFDRVQAVKKLLVEKKEFLARLVEELKVDIDKAEHVRSIPKQMMAIQSEVRAAARANVRAARAAHKACLA